MGWWDVESMGGLLEGCWVRGCVGSLEGGAEAGCWDGAPMLSPIPYLSDNLHIFISEPTIIFLAPTKDPSKATEKHSKKMGMVVTYCD